MRSIATFALFLLLVNEAYALDLANTEWDTVARQHALEPTLLYAIALRESSRRQGKNAVAPWPWTFTVGRERKLFADAKAARHALRDQLRAPRGESLRVGLLGIDVRRWQQRIDEPLALLEPARNLALGAKIFADSLRAESVDPAMAIGRYRYGDDANAARSYGREVLLLMHALGATLTPSRTPRHVRERLIAPLVIASACRHGLAPAFALAIANAESAFNQGARSPKGATGVMQLMPGTAARYGVDATELADNIEGGMRYLRDLSVLFDGDPKLVAAGYNAGERAVQKYANTIPPYRETRTYVRRVIEDMERYRSHACPVAGMRIARR